MKNNKLILMLAFSLLLGACGGGGGNSISTAPPAGDDPRISGGDTQTAFRQTRSQATDVLTPGSRLLPRVFQEDDDTVVRGGSVCLNNFFHFLSGSAAPVMLPFVEAAS